MAYFLLPSAVCFIVKLVKALRFFPVKRFLSSPFLASGSGGFQACPCSLADKVALKFCQCAKNMEYQLPAACCGVNGLLKTLKTNTPLLQEVHQLNQVFQANVPAGQAAKQPGCLLRLADSPGPPEVPAAQPLHHSFCRRRSFRSQLCSMHLPAEQNPGHQY